MRDCGRGRGWRQTVGESLRPLPGWEHDDGDGNVIRVAVALILPVLTCDVHEVDRGSFGAVLRIRVGTKAGLGAAHGLLVGDVLPDSVGGQYDKLVLV